jgi:hypothetical protein
MHALIIHELLPLTANQTFAEKPLERPLFSPLRADQAAFGLALGAARARRLLRPAPIRLIMAKERVFERVAVLMTSAEKTAYAGEGEQHGPLVGAVFPRVWCG